MSLSMDMKRATILFNEPGRGRTIIQESKNKPSEKLRSAIAIAREAFWEAYNTEEKSQ